MAYVSSMTYTTEAQFLEAVAQAKSAQTAREAALAAAAMEQGLSFQAMLNNSIAGYSRTTTAASPAADSQSLDTYFQQAADTYNISVDLLKAVARQESGFQTDIVSSAGAIGVMQLMPGTAEYLGVTDPYNAEQNIMGGAKLLSELSARYNGDLSLTLAAYNAGAGAVDKYGTIPPYQETQNFVAKIKANLGID